MARYVDADKFKYSLELSIDSWSRDFNSKAPTITTTYKEVLHRLETMPTADVVEVKHGEWKRKGQDIYCSVCGNESAYNPFGASKFSDYCPNCGAKMDGKE